MRMVIPRLFAVQKGLLEHPIHTLPTEHEYDRRLKLTIEQKGFMLIEYAYSCICSEVGAGLQDYISIPYFQCLTEQGGSSAYEDDVSFSLGGISFVGNTSSIRSTGYT